MSARTHRSSRRKRRSKTGSGGANYWRYSMLVICVVSQFCTLLITWPVWQVRVDPPNLPMLSTAGFSLGWVMINSLILVLVKPKIGVGVHCALYAVACLFDQFRIQPQFFTHCLLMAAVAYDAGPRMGRWWLASLWLWSGIHKMLSTDWWGHVSWSLVSGLPIDLIPYHTTLAGLIAVSELSLGIMAIVRPKWAAIGCPILHVGIAIFLSPLGADMNYSVIPWNLSLAVVGWWILNHASRSQSAAGSLSASSPPLPKPNGWTAIAIVVLLVSPAGYYFGWTHLYAAHVLYSGGTPRGMITQKEGSRETIGWSELNVPFPQERAPLVQFFEATGQPGDKLHLADSRLTLADMYYILGDAGKAESIDRESFLDATIGNAAGNEVDRYCSVHDLALAGAKMLRREKNGPVYAIEFVPEYFESNQLHLLDGLPNIEELQFENTSITDADLNRLPVMPHLLAIGLEETDISDRGLAYLSRHPNLLIVLHRGSRITKAGLEKAGIPFDQ